MFEFDEMLDCVEYGIDTPILSHLNEYQVATVQRMIQLEKGPSITHKEGNTYILKKSAAGVLANRVGSGKTRCALALALSSSTPFCIEQSALDAFNNADPKVKGLIGATLETSAPSDKYKARTYSEEQMTIHATCDRRTLILAQNHLISQWCSELDKLHIPYEKRQQGRKEPYYVFGEVTLATPTFVRDLNDVYYGRIIYDETDAFRSHVRPGRIKRDFTWLLTATVKDLEVLNLFTSNSS